MLVIGNGESRNSIDINSINDTKVGCNAIYRDFKVDHLVCVDKSMLSEVIQTNHHKRIQIHTRKINYDIYIEDNIHVVPDLPYIGDQRPDLAIHWGSGPYAVLLAAQLTQSNIVHMLGFDLHSDDKLVNNIYKGTTNYAQADKHAVDPRYWIYQIGKVFDSYPTTQFVVHQNIEWNLPDAWNKSNVLLDNIDYL
jgi:hypothetical protein|tara:strand:- start:58 stop:639 length:582 start_codon:yes stop_codon:yes gene_type:complete